MDQSNPDIAAASNAGTSRAKSEAQEPRGLLLERALLADGWAESVEVVWDELGILTKVQAQRSSADGIDANGACRSTKVRGHVVPGLANAHSHAHQRLMAGLAERPTTKDDSFWSWREVMYSFAERLLPEQLEAVAAQAYLEMLEAGFTSVGEFQYLHNQRGGARYDDPAELSMRCLEAARQTGIAVTLLPVLYSRAGFEGGDLSPTQKRFAANVEQVTETVARLARAMATAAPARLERERVGCAPHSLRAASVAEIFDLVESVHATGPAPVHLHIAEQQLEVDDCVHSTGVRPIELLLREAAQRGLEIDSTWSLIHATHASAEELSSLAESGAQVVLCPTTEANLGDGVFPLDQFAASGMPAPLAIGSDSQVRICPAEELRLLELGQRLIAHKRNLVIDPGRASASTGRALYERCLRGGAESVQQPAGSIAEGQRADFVVLDETHPRLIGRSRDAVLDSWIFAGDRTCVREVYVGGERVVADGRHMHAEAVNRRFAAVVGELSP